MRRTDHTTITSYSKGCSKKNTYASLNYYYYYLLLLAPKRENVLMQIRVRQSEITVQQQRHKEQ